MLSTHLLGEPETTIEQLAEASTEPFLKQQPLARKNRVSENCETNIKSCLGNTPKNPFGRHLEDRSS